MAGDRESGYNAFSLFLIFILLYVSQKSIRATDYHQDTSSKQQESSSNEKFAVMVSDGEVMEHSHNQEDFLDDMSEDPNVAWEAEVDELDEIIEIDENVEQDLTDDSVEGDHEAIQVDELQETEEIKDIPVDDAIIPEEEALGDSEQIEWSESAEEAFMAGPSNNASDIPLKMAEEVIEDEPVLGGQSNLFLKPTVMSGLTTKKQQSGPKISFKYSN